MALSSLSTFHSLVKLHKSRHTSQFFPQNPAPLSFIPVGIQHRSSVDPLQVSGCFNTIHQISEDFTPVELLDILRTQKDPTSSLEILGWASKQENFVPAPFVYEEVLQQLGKNGSFNEMMDVIGCMKQSGAKIDQTTFFILVENYTRLSMFNEAVDVILKLMEEKGVEANTLSYNFLLNSLVENGKLKLVEDVYAEMTTRGVCPDVSTFNILIKGLCKAHLIRPAISMMEEMMPCFGILPDEITFTTLMQGLIEEGNMKAALKMKARMIEMECSPTNVTINLLIHGFCKQGKVEEALGFIQKESSASKRGSRFHPDRFTFNTLVNGLCQAGHVSHALEILDVMLQEGFDPDIITYNTLLSGLCKSGEIEDAIELVDEMTRRNCFPNMVSYNTLISTLCGRNRIEEAMELAHGLADKGLKPDIFTFNALIGGLCKVGDHGVALELFNEMKDGGCPPDEFTYNVLIDHFCSSHRGKQLGIALDLLKEMERSGCLRSVITYNTLIDGLCKNRRIEEAEEMFDQMDMQGISHDLVTYNSLIDGLCKNKRFNAATELMDQMLMEGLKPDKLTYNSLLSYHCKNGDIKRAADVMQTMSSNGCEPDMITYGTLIGGLCKAGRTQVASKLLRSIQMKGMVLAPHAYNPVIQALFKQNKTKEAIRLFREMMEKGEPPDGLSYKIVFRGMCRGGGPIGEAVEFLMEMTEVGFIPEFTAFSMLAEGLLALAMEDTLVRVIDQVMMKARFDDQEIAMVRGLVRIRKFHDGLMTLGDLMDSRKPKSYFR